MPSTMSAPGGSAQLARRTPLAADRQRVAPDARAAHLVGRPPSVARTTACGPRRARVADRTPVAEVPIQVNAQPGRSSLAEHRAVGREEADLDARRRRPACGSTAARRRRCACWRAHAERVRDLDRRRRARRAARRAARPCRAGRPSRCRRRACARRRRWGRDRDAAQRVERSSGSSALVAREHEAGGGGAPQLRRRPRRRRARGAGARRPRRRARRRATASRRIRSTLSSTAPPHLARADRGDQRVAPRPVRARHHEVERRRAPAASSSAWRTSPT